ncbi:MAG TPA: haloacid dehalogenase [Planctomycetes bacterium]|nr:haloacid dehalogenase [Planctomycetota bacterium]
MAVSDTPPPYGTIVFDCDSTLSAMEGIEELVGENEEVRRLTALAMDGTIPLEEVYGRRLELVRPTRSDMERIARLYRERRLPHAAELVAALRAAGKRVAVVSGGLLPAVEPFARGLGIEEVHAVDVRFGPDGTYAGFDEDSPLARSGGKLEVLGRIASAPGAGPIVLVGDGATDLEAAPVLDRFIAFGGVERRDLVFDAARVSCTSPDLFELAPLLLTGGERDELRSDPTFRALP